MVREEERSYKRAFAHGRISAAQARASGVQWLRRGRGANIALSLALDRFTLPTANYVQLLLTAVVISVIVISAFIGVNALTDRDSVRYVVNIGKNMLNSFKKRI